jgi:hypothetical protein
MAFDPDTSFYFYRRPIPDEDIAPLHHEVIENFRKLPPPFGLSEDMVPPVPEFDEEKLVCGYRLKYPIKLLRCSSYYKYRLNGASVPDKASRNDDISFYFYRNKTKIDFRELCHDHGALIVQAFKAYRVNLRLDSYMMDYFFYRNWDYDLGKNVYRNKTYAQIVEDPTIIDDARFNVFVLDSVNYWDNILCHRAFGFGPHEVVRRLKGLVPRVEIVGDGVYVVFSDDPHLTYEDYVAYNERLKPILGLKW